jgi:vancomycin permeability regulator SanA
MLKSVFKFILRILLIMAGFGLLGLLLPRLLTSMYAWNKIHSIDDVSSERVAIIFGAGLRRDGTPTTVLRDRVETGSRLYFDGKVEKLLMSGDNQIVYYNEPEAMRKYALSLGIPEQDIILDYAGSRTYDTCYRAKQIFGLESVLLVTQKFHLPRALFLCNSMGIKAQAS